MRSKWFTKLDAYYLILFLFSDVFVILIEKHGGFPHLFGPVLGVTAAYAAARGYRGLIYTTIAAVFIHAPYYILQTDGLKIAGVLTVIISILAGINFSAFLFAKYFYYKIKVEGLFEGISRKALKWVLASVASIAPPSVTIYFLLINFGGFTADQSLFVASRFFYGMALSIILFAPVLLVAWHPLTKNYFNLQHLGFYVLGVVGTTGAIFLVETNNINYLNREFEKYSVEIMARNNNKVISVIDSLRQLRNNLHLFDDVPTETIINNYFTRKTHRFLDHAFIAARFRKENGLRFYQPRVIKSFNNEDWKAIELINKSVIKLDNKELRNLTGFFNRFDSESSDLYETVVYLPFEKRNKNGKVEPHFLGAKVNLWDIYLDSVSKIYPLKENLVAYNFEFLFKINGQMRSYKFNKQNEYQLFKRTNDFVYEGEFKYLNLRYLLTMGVPPYAWRTHSPRDYWTFLFLILLFQYVLVRLQYSVFRRDKYIHDSMSDLENEITKKELAEKKVLQLNTSLEAMVKSRTLQLSERTYELESLFKVIPDALIKVDMTSKLLFVESFSIDSVNLNRLLRREALISEYLEEKEKSIFIDALEMTLLTDSMRSLVLNLKNEKVDIICEVTITKYNSEMALIIMRDVTEKEALRKKIEEQNIQALSHAKLASLGEMAAGIAHEINNPLTIIDGSAHVLQRMIAKDLIKANRKAESALTRIQKTVHRIASIVNGLKKYAREDNAKIEEVDLMSFLDETLSFCRERFSNNGIDLLVDIETEQKTIFCSPIEMSQVLINLLNNAYDAIACLSEKWVKVEVRCTSTHHIIRVIDSGRGVSKQIEDRIMEPFFTTKSIGQGTGLGLSISQGIVKSHSGTLEIITSQKNTCFEVKIPINKLKVVAL